MIHVHRSNRMERLVDALSAVVDEPPPGVRGLDPFEAECIVVQSRGMERFVSMALAQRRSIWANPSFPFPRALLDRAFDAVLGDGGTAAGYSEGALRWSIAARLPRLLERPAFDPIARYLRDDEGGDMLLQLSERLARIFDDYVVYRHRPDDLIARFGAGQEVAGGRDAAWQGELWRDLHGELGDTHVAARARSLVDALQAGSGPIAGLPQRISLFGIASLPPLYLQVFSALASRLDVHLFMLSPSREYWGDIRPAAGRSPEEMAEQIVAEGHGLLASLGRVGREFHQELEGSVQYLERDDELYEDPGEGCLLHALQSDMLNLRERGPGADAPPLEVSPDDHSIQIHACHGPMREVEVLHDQLVEVLQRPGVEPRDVVVMTPDIDAYAPFIEAVFGVAAGRPAIGYRISDRRLGRTHGVIDALDAILDALQGRMPAGTVLDLLGREPIRRRFQILDEELEVLRQWVADSGIRWGVDAAHRQEVQQPELDDNTWRFGLDRMLLGYATGVTPDGPRLFEGRLPYGEVEGGDVELLGKLSRFCQTLFGLRAQVTGTRTLPRWRELLLRIMEALLSAERDLAQQHQVVRDTLQRLVSEAESVDFTRALDLRALRRRLFSEIDAGATARGFLSGGVTFCQLVPMRSIPFKVVCLIGMNDEAFPRRPLRMSFDLIAAGPPRAGDRSGPDDDRYLFLEALLSARERLILTYEGHGIHDNGVKPPSVLVGELLTTLGRGFRFARRPGAGATSVDATELDPLEPLDPVDAEAQLVVHHRLQPFSPHYFGADAAAGGDGRLFSYAQQYFEGARSLGGAGAERPFVEGPLPEPTEALSDVALDELEAFFGHPIRRFLQNRLGLFYRDDIVSVEGREPIALDALQRWQVGDTMLSACLRGHPREQLEGIVRASGRLPPGTPGELEFAALLPAVDGLVEETRRRTGGEAPLPPAPFVLELAGLRVHGVLRELWPTGQLRTQFSRVGGRHDVRLWVRHVTLCALREAGVLPVTAPDASLLIGRGSGKGGAEVAIVRFKPVQGATDLLADLLSLYRLGQRMPLPMDCEASLAHAQALAGGKPAVAARDAARAAFEGHFGGAKDDYVQQVFPDFDALGAPDRELDFEALSTRVLAPLLAHREVW